MGIVGSTTSKEDHSTLENSVKQFEFVCQTLAGKAILPLNGFVLEDGTEMSPSKLLNILYKAMLEDLETDKKEESPSSSSSSPPAVPLAPDLSQTVNDTKDDERMAEALQQKLSHDLEGERSEQESKDLELALKFLDGEDEARAGFSDNDFEIADEEYNLHESDSLRIKRMELRMSGRGKAAEEVSPDATDVATSDTRSVPECRSGLTSSMIAEQRECPVCFCDYDSEDSKVKMSCCGRIAACVDCYAQFVRVKIKEQDVTPWILCPTRSCRKPIVPTDIFYQSHSHLTDEDALRFIQVLMGKRLNQESHWFSCTHEGCLFGFLIFDEKKVKKEKKDLVCRVCQTPQSPIAVLQKGAGDADYQNLIKTGILRPCPKCSFMASKDYGICNIIQCSHCNIWWNWKTRLTGKTKDKLKDMARHDGTLWEPNELEYQQQLERTDKDAFKKLLNSNGIRYNPFYTRGH